MPDETNIPACLGCDHQSPDHCVMCGGKMGTGSLPPCTYCNKRGNPPAQPLPPPTPIQPLTLDEELPEYRTPKRDDGDDYGSFRVAPRTDE
jgi:hypothetical protein